MTGSLRGQRTAEALAVALGGDAPTPEGSSQRCAAPHPPEGARAASPAPSPERAAASARAQAPPPRLAPPHCRAAAAPALQAPPPPRPLEQRGGGGNMEGESTSAVLSGFVLGALAFQHLNTDSDTVSRAAGRELQSPRKRPCARAPRGRLGPGPARGLPDDDGGPALCPQSRPLSPWAAPELPPAL